MLIKDTKKGMLLLLSNTQIIRRVAHHGPHDNAGGSASYENLCNIGLEITTFG